MDTVLLIQRLRAAHPDATCALVHRDPFQLLVATILSAQCTDARVNQVTPVLFQRFPDPSAMSRASQEELEEIIRSTGFFRNKAKALRAASQRLVEGYGGEVPRTMNELLTLPGVARKTASVVLGVAYGVAEGVVVDTHVERVARRLGLTGGRTAGEVERDLMQILPREQWIDFAHLLIFHGRRVCQARKPNCPACTVRDLCASAPYFLTGKVPPFEAKRRGVAPPVRAAASGRRKTVRPARGKARRAPARAGRKRAAGSRSGG